MSISGLHGADCMVAPDAKPALNKSLRTLGHLMACAAFFLSQTLSVLIGTTATTMWLSFHSIYSFLRGANQSGRFSFTVI